MQKARLEITDAQRELTIPGMTGIGTGHENYSALAAAANKLGNSVSDDPSLLPKLLCVAEHLVQSPRHVSDAIEAVRIVAGCSDLGSELEKHAVSLMLDYRLKLDDPEARIRVAAMASRYTNGQAPVDAWVSDVSGLADQARRREIIQDEVKSGPAGSILLREAVSLLRDIPSAERAVSSTQRNRTLAMRLF